MVYLLMIATDTAIQRAKDPQARLQQKATVRKDLEWNSRPALGATTHLEVETLLLPMGNAVSCL